MEAKGNQVPAVNNEGKRVKVRRVIAARLETRLDWFLTPIPKSDKQIAR